MIIQGESYKPLHYFKKNRKNLSKSGTIVSVTSDYVENRKKTAKLLTLEELEDLLK